MRALKLIRPLALSLALAYPAAHALPQGAQVVQGQVVINPGLIQQGSDKAIVNWQSFSIGANETLRVQQPGINSVLLNRVVGGDPSLILGQLQANGRVFLVNPRGIVFGRGSQVDVGGLVASTLDLSDTNFIAGNYRFSAAPGAGALQADGSIKATGGTVALIAPQLDVGGSIDARRVGLGAAPTVQVDVEGDGLVLFNLRNDDNRDVALKFSGRVLADGSAEMRAQARAGAAGQVLNMDGLVQARGFSQQGGRIVIDGGTAGVTSINGKLDATGDTGGAITVLGQHVALLGGARLDASGRLAGGSLQVGGGFKGEGTEHNAERTWIATGAELRADATEQGDGGRIAVWADQRTDFYGSIFARGGRLGGNGGSVETSGRQQLNVLGSVDASAPLGRAGQWLLDPNDVVIKANSGTNVNVGAAPDFTTTDDAAIVDLGALNTALSGGTAVKVETTNTSAAPGGSAQSGDITVEGAIVPTGAATLTLKALRDITFTSGSIGAGAGVLTLSLDAARNITGTTIDTNNGNITATAAGTISLGSVTGKDLTINGGAGTVTLPGGTLSGALNVNTTGAIAQGGSLAVTGSATLATTTNAAAVTLGALDSGGLSVTTNNGVITLGSGTVSGNLSASSSGAEIKQTGALTVTGTSTFNAGAAGGAITLGQSNDFQDTVTLTGGVTQVKSSALKLGAANITGTLNATTTGGALSQDASLTVSSDVTLNAGGGSITLGAGTFTALTAQTSGTGAITQTGTLLVNGAATLTGGSGGVSLGTFSSNGLDVGASGNITLGIGTITGALVAAATGTGTITQAGALSVTGNATLSSNTGVITLGSFGSGGDVGITSTSGAVTLGTGNIAGTLTASTGGAGAVTQAPGGLTVGGLATLTSGSGGVTLGTFDSHGLGINATNSNITLGVGTITGTLNATTTGTGTITQAGALTVTSDATLTTAGGALTLGSFGSGGNVSLNSTSGVITLGTGNITGTLTASTGGVGAIAQASGSLTVGGLATLTGGSGGVALGTFDSHGLGINATNAGIVLGVGTITGALTATTTGTGTITQAGALNVTSDATLTTASGALTLGSFGSGGDVGLNSTSGAITLGTGSITGALTAATGGAGAVTQASGSLTVGGLATLTSGSGGVTLGTFDSHGLGINATNAGIVLGVGTITGALTATTTGTGTITQAGALSVTSDATLTTASGALTLGSFGSGGNVSLNSTSGAITLGTGNITGTLTASTGGVGAITQASGSLTVGGLATLTGGSGGVTLGTFDSHGLGINATNSNITLGVGTITGALTATTTGTGTITQAGALSVTSDATLTTATGALTLGSFGSGGNVGLHSSNGAITLGTGNITGNLSVTSSGAPITQASGGVTVGGTAGFNAGAGAITLTEANDFQGTVTLTGAATQIKSSALTLGATNISSTLQATTTSGAINHASGTLAASGAVTLNAGSSAITLGTLNTGHLTATTTAGNITLGSGSVAALNASTGSTGAISQAAGTLSVTGAAVLSTASGSLTLGTFDSGNLSATTNGGTLTLGTGTVTGTLTAATSGGNIAQAAGGLTVTTTSSLNAGAGNITLGQANDLHGAITLTGGAVQLTNSGANALTLTSVSTTGNLGLTTGGGDIEIGPGSVGGTLNASSSGGDIRQAAGTLGVTGLSTLNAGAGSIVLGSFNSGGLSATTNAGALTLGTGTINGTLTAATSGGVIDQAGGGLIVTGLASLNAGAAAITLTDPDNDWRAAVSLTGGVTQVTSTRNAATTLTLGTLNTGNLTVSTAGGALDLGGGSVNGTLNASSNGGAISQTSALNVSGITTLDATLAGNISLTDTGNIWNGLNITGNSLDLRAGSDLEILSLTQPSNRALTLLAGQNLILGPAASINTGTANLRLASLGGTFTMGGVLAGHDIDLEAHSGLVLGQNITAAGTLKLTTASGGIDQTGGTIVATGATTVASGASFIRLNRATNNFVGAVSLSGGVTGVTDAGALTLGTLATGNLTVSSTGLLNLGKGTVTGTLNANSHGFAISQDTTAGAGLTLTGATTLNAGTQAITLANATNDLQGAITATGGAVSLRSANNLHLFSLTQPANQGLELQAGGTLTLPAGTNNIDTGNAALTLSSGGVFSTFGTLKGGVVTLKGTSATLGHDITATTSLNLQTTAGAITQNGGRISVTGASTFDAGASSISLTRSQNNFQGNVSLTGTSAHIVALNNLTLATMAVNSLQAEAGGSLQLGTGTLSGNLSASAGGAITQAAGGLRVTGTSSFSGTGSITLLETTNAWTGAVSLSGGAAQFYSSGALTLGGGNLSSLSLTTGGALSQSGGLTVNGALTVNTGGAAIGLSDGGNHLNGTVTLTGGTTQVSNAGPLTLGTLAVGTLTLQSSGNLNLGQGNIGGSLNANSGGGAITQAGVLNVNGATSLQAGGGSITLTQGGNQWGGALSLAGGTTQVTSNGGLTLGTLAVGALTVDATGALVLGQGSVGGVLTANSHGGAITQSGALDVTGTANLQSGGGAITLNQAGNRWRGVVQITGGATQISGTGALTLGTLATADLTANSTGALNLGQGVISGNLTAASGGSAVTQAGALQVTGSTTINAGGGNITLANTGNRFVGPMNLTGNAVTLFNQPSLVLGALNFHSLDATSNGGITLGSGNLSGTLTAKALGGAITQTAGGIEVAGTSTLQASGAITLTDAANRLRGKVNVSGGATSLTNAADLALGTVATGALTLDVTGALDLGTGSISGALNATSTGAITQTGALSVTGASNLNAGSAAITLTQAGNAFVGPVSLRGGNTQITNGGALSLGAVNVGNLTVVSSGTLQLGTGTVAGDLKATSGGAISQTAGGLRIAGATTLEAGSNTVLLTDAANDFVGAINLRSGNASLAGSAALHLASYATRDLTLSAGGNIELDSGSVTGTLNATAAGALIRQTGALTVTGPANFRAANGAVQLGGFTTGPLTINAGGDIDLAGGQVNGALVATSTRGRISQTGVLAVTGAADFNAAGGGVSLGGFTTGDLTISAGGDIELVNGQVNGGLTAATTGGQIRQTGSLTVAGAASFSAAGGGVSLGGFTTGVLTINAGGDIELVNGKVNGGLTAASTGGQIRQTGSLAVTGAANFNALGGGVSLGGFTTGDLAINAGGDIELFNGQVGGGLTAASTGGQIRQTGSLAVTAAASFNALGGGVSLGGFTTGVLTINAGGDIELVDGKVNGGLTAASTGGQIRQTGSLAVTGAANFTAVAGGVSLGGFTTGALAINAGGDIELVNGQVGGSLTAASTGGQIRQTGTLTVAGAASFNVLGGGVSLGGFTTGVLTINAGGDIELVNGKVNGGLTAASTGGQIRQTGSLTVAGAASFSAAGGGVSVGGFTTGNLAITAGGDIEIAGGQVNGGLTAASTGGRIHQTGLLAVTGAASLAAGGEILLGSFTTGALTLDAGGNIDLGTSSVGADLKATTRGTKIGQTGALTVQGSSTFIADGSLVDLVLDQAGNQLLGPIQMLGINGGSFLSANLSSALDLSFSGDVQTLTLSTDGLLTMGGGRSTTLTAAARRGIVQTGALEVSGQTTLIAKGGAAMPVTLTHSGNDFNRVALQSQAGGSLGAVQLRDGDASRHDGLQVSGDAAALTVTSAGALDLGGGRYGSLVADTAAGNAAITQSGALAVTGLTTLKAGSGDITLTRADNSLASITVASAGVASLVSAGAYTVNASNVSTRLELGGPGAIQLTGPLSGSGELVMSGTGALTISTAQTYTGGTRINTGSVVLQGPAAQAGTGAVQLGAAGQLDLRDGATLGAELVAQGGMVLNTSGSGTLAGPVTLQADTTFLPAAGAGGLTISGAISGSSGIQLGSAGVLTLTGNNRYTGTTDIAAGTLRANGAGALPATSAVQLAAGAVLSLGLDQTVGSLAGAGRVELGRFTLATGADGRDTAFSGSILGSGALTKLGNGRFTLSGSNAHTGATRVAGGELVLASATALNDVTAVTVDAGALLTVQQSASLGSLAGAGVVDVQAALLSVGANGGSTSWSGSIVGSGGLAKLGGGVFTLAGHNTFAGDVQVNAGTLQLLGDGARPLAVGATTGPVVPATVGIHVAGGAMLELLSDQNLGALSGGGRVLLNPWTLTLGASGRSGRFDGVISGSGGLTQAGAGTLTLGGANLYTGTTLVNGGALVLDTAQALAGGSALVIAAPGRVQANARQAVASLNGTGSLVLNGAPFATGSGGSDARFDGVVSGSGSLVKQGAGTLTLTAANTHAGGTVIEAGTVQLTSQGNLGSGDIQNQGVLRLARSDAYTLDQAVSGRGSLVVAQGQVTLANAANSYTGATQVLAGSLNTTAAERLPDASAVQLAAGAQLNLGGNETIASLQAAGSVRLAGNLTTRAEQVYTGSLTLANAAGVTLTGTLIDASRSTNQFGGTLLGLSGGQALVTVKEALKLGDVTLSGGGRIEADRLALEGKLQLTGGNLGLIANVAPDDAKATLQGTAQVPVVGQPMAIAEATVQQGAGSVITLAENTNLSIVAHGGGSVLLARDANSFRGQLSVLSGDKFDTAWVPNVKGAQAIQSLVHVSGQQVLVGGSGIEADTVYLRADQLATAGDSRIVARLPFDDILLGRALSAPGLTLELAPGAFGLPGSFGLINGQGIQVAVGTTETGGRTSGPNAGYVTVLPKTGAQGATAVVLLGPKVGSVPASGGPGYRFFHDGASQAAEVPVVYNGVLPLTPAASGAISSINGDAEDARRARFQETVRTENVTVRLRSGVIAEVGPGRPSTQGSEGAKPPELCDPAEKPALSCKPSNPTTP